jgi:hypothetical protein
MAVLELAGCSPDSCLGPTFIASIILCVQCHAFSTSKLKVGVLTITQH